MHSLPFKTLVSNGFLALAGICFLFGTAVTVSDVCLRALAGTNIPGAIELTSLSIGLGALLSMPVCYAKQGHVSARLLSELAPARFARPFGLLGSFVSAGFAGLILWAVGQNAIAKLGSPETTPDLGFPIPIALTIVTLALLAAFIAALAGAWFVLRNEKA